MQALVTELNPPPIRLMSNDTKKIWERFQTLQAVIVARHARLATFFVKYTEQGQVYMQNATKRHGNKSKIPRLDSKEILEALQLSSGALCLLWMPIVPVVTGEWAVSTATDGSDLGNCPSYLRTFTADFIGIIARLYSNQKEEIFTSVQVRFFSANSHPNVDREWPNWNFESSEVNLYRNGVFLSKRDCEMFDSYIDRISTIAGVNSEDEDDEILSDEGDSDGDRISSLLGKEAKEITSRPMEFGSEFGETGGIGMPKDVMNDVLSVDKPHVAALAGTLRWTAQRLECPEIDIAEIASLANVGVQGLARYTIECDTGVVS